MKTKLLSLWVALLATTALWAYDFQSGDLYYNITSRTEPFTVEVTYQNLWSKDNYRGLTSVTIPATVTYNNTTYSVTSIGERAFSGCTGLTTIAIPESVTSIGDYAFVGCTGLTSITIPNSVTSIGFGAFSGCTGLTSVTIPESVTSIGSYAFGKVPNIMYNGTATGSPWGARSVNGYVDGYFVYADATKATLLACSSAATGATTIPNSVTSIGNSAFDGCTGLTAITIPNSVTSIGNSAFYGCTGLTAITIPNSVTSIGNYAFYFCSALIAVTISESVTSIGNNTFSFCTGLASITLPNSITSIGEETFSNCANLSVITIPNSVTSIGNSAFSGCTSLASIAIPNSVTSLGNSACSGCTSLASAIIGNNVTRIGNSTFDGCTGLTSITISHSVTSIGVTAFRSCKSLTTMTIPNSVTRIGDWAFRDCTSLTAITILAETPPTIHANTLKKTSLDKIYIPCGTKDAYQAAANWSSFTNYIETLFYILTITAQDEAMGSIRIIQEATCTDNTAVIEATANEGYRFVQWSDGNTDNPRTLIVDEDLTLTAQFVSLTAINNTSADNAIAPRKLFRNGQVLILRNDKTYTLTGVKVE